MSNATITITGAPGQHTTHMATPGWLIEFALDGGRVTHALTVNRSWCQLDEGHDTMHLEGQLAQAPAVPADPYPRPRHLPHRAGGTMPMIPPHPYGTPPMPTWWKRAVPIIFCALCIAAAAVLGTAACGALLAPAPACRTHTCQASTPRPTNPTTTPSTSCRTPACPTPRARRASNPVNTT